MAAVHTGRIASAPVGSIIAQVRAPRAVGLAALSPPVRPPGDVSAAAHGSWAQQHPAVATAACGLMGGVNGAVFLARGGVLKASARRSFSTTARCQSAQQPAPNVASSADTDADAVADSLGTMLDPAVFGWWPSSFAELGIVAVHEATGVPWWMCISGITLVVRTMLLPLVIYQVPRCAAMAGCLNACVACLPVCTVRGRVN
jgi:hypothetical protein